MGFLGGLGKALLGGVGSLGGAAGGAAKAVSGGGGRNIGDSTGMPGGGTGGVMTMAQRMVTKHNPGADAAPMLDRTATAGAGAAGGVLGGGRDVSSTMPVRRSRRTLMGRRFGSRR